MAATSIVRLSLESNQYEQGLRGAKKQFEEFSASIGINMKKMTAYGIAAGVAASAINKLTSELSECISQSTELAKAGEGIRLAFDRLNRPDLLNSLREATHGTVTDLELMKAAVQFNDFKLPLDELGTMLAFAQKKAKDTGQSVDYLVNSIVTGLGRKSKMILDNLGLSASEIDEKMKWDLSSLYKSDEVFNEDFKYLENNYLKYKDFEGKLNSASSLYEFLNF